MTLLCALMPLARKEFLTDTSLTDRYLISAFSPLFTQQSNYLFATTRTIADTCRCFLTRLALSFMAHFLASMFSAVQWFVANVVADEFLGATLDCAIFLLAEALD